MLMNSSDAYLFFEVRENAFSRLVHKMIILSDVVGIGRDKLRAWRKI